MAVARAVAPVEMGGQGLDCRAAGKQFGISGARVSQIVREPDIAEIRKDWETEMMRGRRSHGAEFLAAEKELLEQREVRMVIAYGSQMGLSLEPAIGVNIERLEVAMDAETRDLLASSPIIDSLPPGDEDAVGSLTESPETEKESSQAPSSDS